jgi:hypothetical protein
MVKEAVVVWCCGGDKGIKRVVAMDIENRIIK